MVQPSIMKSHKHSKIIETYFDRLCSIVTGPKIIAGSRTKSMTPNFVIVVGI